MKHVTAMFALLLSSSAVMAAGDADDELLFQDVETDGVNEGVLRFLSAPPGDRVHSHETRIELDAAALQDGWGRLYQCHSGIDRVASAQIVYKKGRVRDLVIEHAHGIGRAWVEGVSVQLEDISETARLCVRAESRVVHNLSGGRFVVRNGPFMRRFLDGYYPMHVRLEIGLPPGRWMLEKSTPAVQPGFNVVVRDDGIAADAWFEGQLATEFYFRPADNM